MAINNIENNEGGGSARGKLNESISKANQVDNKIEKVPTAIPGNVAIFGAGGVILDSGVTPSGGQSANIPTWEDIQFIPVPLNYTVQYNSRLFASKIADNLNNLPPLEGENDYWIEVSEATGNGFGNYSVGIYYANPTMVVKNLKLYLLNTDIVTLPFNSTDFETELADNKWVLASGGGEGLTPEQAASILSSQTRLDTLTIKAKQLTGFENPIDTIVSYDATTRTVTITGDVSAYWQGNPMTSIDPTFVSGWESEPHAVPVGLQVFFLYFNGTSFVWSNTPWTFDLLQIALIFRDGVNFGIRECHGLMDQYTHDIVHKVIGTRMTSGGDLTGFTLNSTTAANRRPLIASALIEDEDLPTVLDELATPSYTRFNLSGANTIAITQAQTEIISITGNQPNYNQFTGGNWIQTPFPVNAYAKIFVFAIPVCDSVGCQPNRFIFVQPQTVNTSLETIQNLTAGSVNLAGLAPAINEFVYFAEVIIRFTAGNWQLISVAKITGSQIGQAVLLGNFLSSVTTDATLTGTGTASSPLSAVQQLNSLEWQYNSATFGSDLIAGQFQFNAAKTILYLSYVLNPNLGLGNTIQNYVEGIKSGSKFIFRDSTGKVLELVTTSDAVQVGASIFAQMNCTVLNDSGISNGLSCVVEIAGVSSGGGGLTPEQAAELAAATEHIDGVDELKHESFQIINEEALPNIEIADGAKVSDILNAIDVKIGTTRGHIDWAVNEKHQAYQIYVEDEPLSDILPTFVNTSQIDMTDIAVGEKKILVAEKGGDGNPIFAGGVGLLDVIANPGLATLLAETASGWVGDEITLTGDNRNGGLGENSQFFELDSDFFLCKSHNNGTTNLNGSATWKRNRGTDCLNLSIASHVTIIGQLETETGWNALAQFKQITAKSKLGTWFRRTTGGYLYMCIDNSNGWTRVGTPPTESLEITTASHPVLTASLNAHDFTANRFYVEKTNASDETAGQGQQYWNTTTKNVFQRDMLGNWAKMN